MQRGLIYVLINPCMTGLVKIGMTTRTAEERAREISVGTGVPSPYAVAYEEEFFDCYEAENIIHERLDKYRFNQDREFFRLPVKDAIRVINDLAVEFKKRERIIKRPETPQASNDTTATKNDPAEDLRKCELAKKQRAEVGMERAAALKTAKEIQSNLKKLSAFVDKHPER